MIGFHGSGIRHYTDGIVSCVLNAGIARGTTIQKKSQAVRVARHLYRVRIHILFRALHTG